MASIEGDESKMTEIELSFLDLKDCSQETRTYLLALLEDESKPKTSAHSTVATSASESAAVVTQPPPQQPAQHHFQQVCLLCMKEKFV